MVASGLPHIYIVAIKMRDNGFAKLVEDRISRMLSKRERFKVIFYNGNHYLVFRALLRITLSEAENKELVKKFLIDKSEIAIDEYLRMYYHAFGIEKNMIFSFERIKESKERLPYKDQPELGLS